MTTITEPVQLAPPLFEPGDLVVVINHIGRADQYGEISYLPAPSGLIYVRIARHEHSRNRSKALAFPPGSNKPTGLAGYEHGALAALAPHQLRKVA
jgi:hypothetical protein